MDADRVERRLRGLDFWRGPIEVSPLAGGISNRNFLVEYSGAGRRFAARFGEDRPLLGIDRRNEVACQRAAAGLGIAPEVVYSSPGVLISEFLEARTLTREEVCEPARLAAIARVVRRLHEAGDRTVGAIVKFSAFDVVLSYGRAAVELGAETPPDLGELLDDARGLARRIGAARPALCHNDLLAANILEGPAGRLWLVDWEYAGVGHPLFDLANLASNAGLSAEQEESLLAAYRGTVGRRDLDEFRIFRAVSSLREALWALVQSVASDLDFDYGGYARENFVAYRESRSRLELSPPAS